MTDFTVDEFITEMEKLFGVEDQGYIKVLEKAKELKKENEKLQDGKPTFRQLYENQNMEFEGQKNKISYLEKENAELKKNRFNYNVFDTERNNMVILLQQQKEENEELEKRIESTISFIKLCDNNEAGYTNYETRNIASRLIDGNITEDEEEESD
tara:strand:- start:722 stop:1186 length:465 start_codon:yes stop_codon:yes gene_type:complete